MTVELLYLQFKTEESQKQVRRDVIVERPLEVPEASIAPSKSPVIGRFFCSFEFLPLLPVIWYIVITVLCFFYIGVF